MSDTSPESPRGASFPLLLGLGCRCSHTLLCFRWVLGPQAEKPSSWPQVA